MNKLSVFLACLTLLTVQGCGSSGALWDGHDCSADCGVRDARVTETTPERAVVALTVALSPDTPPGATILRNSTRVVFLRFTLTATDGEVTLTGLRLHRVGVGSTSDIADMYLFASSGVAWSTTSLISNQPPNTVEFNSLDQHLRAGQTLTFDLVAPLAIPTAVGGQHAFEITDVTAITQHGADVVRGSFPIRGNVFTVGTACAVVPGALVKASGPAVYFIGRDHRRYVFPNDRTYFSWYPDFSGVCTLADTEVAAIRNGGNVTIRPGTWLVKITTDPKVYAITHCGIIHWIMDEGSALTLYGPAWNTRVVDVPDGFFVNYSVGEARSAPYHSQGTLISYAGDPTTVYVIDEYRQRRRISSDYAFNVNRFRREFVVVTEQVYADGSPVIGYEDALSETVCTY